MSRPKKRATIEKQLQAVITQAVEEGRHELAKELINLLAKQAPGKEGE